MPPVYPLQWQPATWRGHYENMAKRDRAVWDRFLAMFSDNFQAFAYNVALGGLELQGTNISDEEILGWRYTTALKIDVVGQAADLYWIIEVRPEAQVSALGAALTYSLVAKRDEVFPGRLIPTIVCYTMQVDARWAAEKLGVQVVTVPPE